MDRGSLRNEQKFVAVVEGGDEDEKCNKVQKQIGIYKLFKFSHR